MTDGKWRLALAAVALACGLASGAPAAEPTAAGVPAQEGRALTLRWCTSCHVVDAKRTGTDAVPTFQAIADEADTSAARLKGYLLKPHGEMPDFHLSLPHIDAIIAYILSLRTAE